MKKSVRAIFCVSVILLCMFTFVTFSLGADFDSVLQKWSRTYKTKGELGDELVITATYYSAEYIEALVQKEAELNLWTESEMEDYKYELLKVLKLTEYIPIMLSFDMKGAP
ncbi:hypothetical protein [Acetomicrobium sp.]|nr:hypothetical protein [Acetomicrobium sp.]MDR9771008.1 hypothetical protein [Acetomicrobium sp.]